jgi:hypothetical protein
VYSVRDIILAIIEEEGFGFSLCPVDLPWAEGVVMALIIPMEKSEKVIEFYTHEDNIVCAHEKTKHNNGTVGNAKTIKFNFVHPDTTEDLRQYLEENCYKRHTTIEFEDNWDLNYTFSEVV